MVNRVRRGKSVPEGSGETSGLMVHDTGLAVATSKGPAVVDFGPSDRHVVAVSKVGNPVMHIRKRFTAAQVNAGATLLPAIPGYKWRLVDAAMISIGGAAAGATNVRLRATQGASAVSLFDAAVAGLTQDALLRIGAANAAILAGGLSFVANDANTAVTIDKITASLTGSTNIDVLAAFALEKA